MLVKKKNKHCLLGLAKVLVCSGGLRAEHHLFVVPRMSTGCTGVLSVHDLLDLLVSPPPTPYPPAPVLLEFFFPVTENKLAPLPSFRGIN